MTAGRRSPAGARIVRLYPRAWRTRYGEEMLALLEMRPASGRRRLDLLRGALDAHMHPPRRSRLPGLAAVAGGGMWTTAAVVVLGQPTQPDWPGYLVEILPLAIVGIACLAVATVGCWLRLGDAGGRIGAIAIAFAVVGHGAWLVAVLAAAAELDYGASTAAASGLAATGTAAVGLALLRAADSAVGMVVLVGGVAMLVGPGIGWLIFGLAWTLVGLLMLRELEAWIGRSPSPT